MDSPVTRCDAVVLGAGIVGTSTALHLAERGLSVVLVDRQGPGQGTSYGNAGVIDGAGGYPTPFPRSISKLLRIILKIAPEANYHPSSLPWLAAWLWANFKASAPHKLEEVARVLRPLFANSVAEHQRLMTAAGATRYLRKTGWIFLYRSGEGFRNIQRRLALSEELGSRVAVLDPAGTQALEPHLSPVFRHAVYWPDVASVSNPLAVTRAYIGRFSELGGRVLTGDARSLRRSGSQWRVETTEGEITASMAVIALGPWTQDVLDPLGLRLPLAVQRGYHRHFQPLGNAGLTRPIVDSERGYVLTPMEQGTRLTTGAEFADRDAPPTPVQFRRVLSDARRLFPLGDPIEAEPWLGSRPCLPDMMPVIGPAPGLGGLWLNFGHNHFGLTLGPVSGRLLAEMMTGATPFCDPAPFAAQRFLG